MTLVVIGLGLGQTGTHSLQAALERLGYGPCLHADDMLKSADARAIRAWLDIARGGRPRWDDIFDGHRSIASFPAWALYEDLLRDFPDAQVILTVRDPSRWFADINAADYAAYKAVPWWLKWLSPSRRAMRELERRLIVDGKYSGRLQDREHAIDVFQAHTRAVRDAVEPEKLLEYDVERGWKPLCDFLDEPEPAGVPFPHLNDVATVKRRLRRKAIRYRIVEASVIVLVVLLAVLFGVRPAAGESAEPVTLLFNQFTPRTHWYHYRILEPWISDLEEATEGRVRIRFTTASLGPFNRNFDIANQGMADIAAGNHSATPGRFQLIQILQSPFLASERAEAVSVALWRVYDRYLRAADEHGDTHVLAVHGGGGGHVFSLSKPVRRFSDLKGMKMFAGGNQNARVLEHAGAIPIHRPMAEAYDLISRGVVDGGLMPHSGLTGWHLLEFVEQELVVPGGILPGSFFVVVNNASWNRIAERDREAIMRVSGEAYARRAGAVFDGEAESALEVICESQTELAVADAEFATEFAEAAGFIDREWVVAADAAGIDGEAALRFFRDEVAGYARQMDAPPEVWPPCLRRPDAG